MAFSDRIVEPGIALVPYLTISGLPYVWSNRSVPANWEISPGSGTVSIGGEIYTWQSTLLTDSDFATISQSINATGGLGVTGDHTFRFSVAGDIDADSDVMLGLAYANAIANGDEEVTRAVERLKPDTTSSYPVESTTGFSASGHIHVSKEAIGYVSTTSTAFSTLTRGAYESKPLWHMGGDDLAEWGTIGGSPFVSTHPIAMQGRVMRLWLAPGRLDSGSFVPSSSSIRGSDDAEVFAGLLDSIRPANGSTEVEIGALGLLHLLSSEIATRLPRGIAGLPDARRIQVAADNRTLYFDWVFLAQSVVSATRYINAEDLVSGISSPTSVSNGLYPNFEIGAYLRDTINNGGSPFADLGVAYTIGPDRKARFEVKTAEANSDLWTLRIDASIRDSFWRELGFEGVLEVEPTTVGAYSVWTFDAKRALPTFRLPAGSLGRRIYYHRPSAPDLLLQTGTWRDVDGENIRGALRIGNKEVVSFGSVGVTDGFNFVQVSERAAYGSTSDEEIYVEWNPSSQKSIEVVQGIGFEGLGDFKAALYLLLGGSGVSGYNDATYDKGWRGSGAYLDSSLIDIDSFEGLDLVTQPPRGRDNRFIGASTDLRSWLNAMLIESQALIVATWSSSDSRYKLRAKQVRPALETDRNSAHVVDESVTWTGGADKLDVEIDEGMIVNSSTVRIGKNHATGGWLQTLQSFAATSIGTWGRKERFDFEIGSTSDPLEASDAAIDLLGSIYRALGIPYAIVSVPCADPSVWTWQLFDPVVLTHSAAPKRLTTGRGISDVLGTIVGKVDVYRGPASGAVRSVLRVLVADYGGSRWSIYAPTVRGTVAASSTRIESIEDHAYSGNSDPLDISHFADDYSVRIYKRGDESSAVVRVASSVVAASGDASYIDLSSSIALTGEVVVEFDLYSSSSIADGQLDYCYQSDSDGKLDKSAGADLAFRYM